MLATVFASFLYTAIGGLRSDAFANFVQNVIKLLVFTGIIGVLYAAMKRLPFDTSLKASFFPPFSQVVSNLGWFGLITNLAFSLVWQFVDMSTWQSVIASRPDAGAKSAK